MSKEKVNSKNREENKSETLYKQYKEYEKKIFDLNKEIKTLKERKEQLEREIRKDSLLNKVEKYKKN